MKRLLTPRLDCWKNAKQLNIFSLRGSMPDQDVIANQKTILENQKSIIANQGAIQKNQEEIKSNQIALQQILKNQDEILAHLRRYVK